MSSPDEGLDEDDKLGDDGADDGGLRTELVDGLKNIRAKLAAVDDLKADTNDGKSLTSPNLSCIPTAAPTTACHSAYQMPVSNRYTKIKGAQRMPISETRFMAVRFSFSFIFGSSSSILSSFSPSNCRPNS